MGTDKIVVSGESVGAHLALTTGMIPASAGLDAQCPGRENLKVAAIINWSGIADVSELLEGPHVSRSAVAWLGSSPNRKETAERVSPLRNVRSGLPPVLTIHGDADPTIPYTQATRLRDALTKAGVRNELLTVPGGGHIDFPREEMLRIHSRIREFLRSSNLNGIREKY